MIQLVHGSRITYSLLKIRAQAAKEARGLFRDLVGLVGRLGAVGSMVLGVEVLQGRHEPVGYTMLVVELDRTLNGSIANDVTVGEVLGEDAAAGLLLLGDLVTVTLGVGGGARVLVGVLGGDVDLGAGQLRVVQQQGRLGGRLLLKDNGGRLCAVGALGYLEFCDLAAIRRGRAGLATMTAAKVQRGVDVPEAEEVSNLLLLGLGRDVLNVDGEMRSHGRAV
jgi:hypothetical protein